MNKCTRKTVIQLEFLKVKEGEEFLITLPEDCDCEEFARIIRANLRNDGVVLTNAYIDHEFVRKDD